MTASTAAGNFGVDSEIFGICRGVVSGIAPRAHVAVYRVCAQEGCFSSDAMAGVEQAIADGVHVVNFSVGGGEDPYNDAVELSFLGAYAAGCLWQPRLVMTAPHPIRSVTAGGG